MDLATEFAQIAFKRRCMRLAEVGLHSVGIVKPALHPELRAAYANRLAELRGKLDKAYAYSDDYTYFMAHHRMAKEIEWLDQQLKRNS